MIYRSAADLSQTRLDGSRALGNAPRLPSSPSPSTPSAASDNPLLSAMTVAGARLTELQTQADQWLVRSQDRIAIARNATGFAAQLDAMSKSADGRSQTLPDSLSEFVVRHKLVSEADARAPFDAAGQQALAASLRSLALNDGASSTSEQIKLKRLVTSYDNTLTLYNSVISRLSEMMKKIVSSL